MRNQMISLRAAVTQVLVGPSLLLFLAGLFSIVSSEQYAGFPYSSESSGSYADLLQPKVALADFEPISSVVGVDEYGREQQQQDLRGNPLEDLLVDSLVERWAAARRLEEQPEQFQWVGSQQQQQTNKRGEDDNSAYYYYDVNSHLPPFGQPDERASQDEATAAAAASSDSWQAIRGPVNDPEEFEAQLGQLTDLLNHQMSNSAARQQLLLGLMNESSGAAASAVNNNNNEDDENDDDSAQVGGKNLVAKLDKMIEEERRARQQQQQQQDENETNSDEGALDTTGLSAGRIEASTGEYIDHPLALFGHQLVQGGAGEGRQLLGPEGTFENIQVIKTDSAIPSYCDPPNPCPLGRSAKDGCLEEFVNSASFSREYQAKQRCSCDNEHSLFNCASTPTHKKQGEPAEAEGQAGAKLDTLARTIQNRYGNLESVRKLISEQQELAKDSDSMESERPDSNHLVRSARKLATELHEHKMELD